MPPLASPSVEVARASRRSDARAGKIAAGWIPERELDEPQWAAVGKRMGAIERASQWWIGDWLRYGFARWGEKYTLASQITSYDVPSLRNMAWLAGEFDVSRRRDALTWSHHAAVAGLEPEEQDEWLDHAEKRRLAVADLRAEVRLAQRGSGPPVEPKDEGEPEITLCPVCGQKLPRGHRIEAPEDETAGALAEA